MRTPTRSPVPAHLVRDALASTRTTQAELARRLDVDVSTVAKWVGETNPVTPLAWAAVTHVLGLPLDWRPSDVPQPATATTTTKQPPRRRRP